MAYKPMFQGVSRPGWAGGNFGGRRRQYAAEHDTDQRRNLEMQLRLRDQMRREQESKLAMSQNQARLQLQTQRQAYEQAMGVQRFAAQQQEAQRDWQRAMSVENRQNAIAEQQMDEARSRMFNRTPSGKIIAPAGIEYSSQMKYLEDQKDQYDYLRARLTRDYGRMNPAARNEFNKLRKKGESIDNALQNGRINTVEALNAKNMIYHEMQQFPWSQYFTQHGENPGDVITSQDGIIKVRTEKGGLEATSYTPDYIKKNTIQLPGSRKMIVPTAPGKPPELVDMEDMEDDQRVYDAIDKSFPRHLEDLVKAKLDQVAMAESEPRDLNTEEYSELYRQAMYNSVMEEQMKRQAIDLVRSGKMPQPDTQVAAEEGLAEAGISALDEQMMAGYLQPTGPAAAAAVGGLPGQAPAGPTSGVQGPPPGQAMPSPSDVQPTVEAEPIETAIDWENLFQDEPAETDEAPVAIPTREELDNWQTSRVLSEQVKNAVYIKDDQYTASKFDAAPVGSVVRYKGKTYYKVGPDDFEELPPRKTGAKKHSGYVGI